MSEEDLKRHQEATDSEKELIDRQTELWMAILDVLKDVIFPEKMYILEMLVIDFALQREWPKDALLRQMEVLYDVRVKIESA